MNPGREQRRCRRAAGARRRGPRGQAAALAATFACLAALVGCGSDEKAEKKASPFSAITKAPAPDNKPKHAAPRWEPLERFSGRGREVGQLDVSPKAIQWRVRWRCRTGRIRLAVRPAPADGKPLEDERCPKRGEAVSVQTGKQRLEVKASGRWTMTIEQQVDTPLYEPPLRGMSDDRLLARGGFYPIDKPGKGTASLYRLAGGRLALRLDRFATSANTDLFVWLSEGRRPKTTEQAFKAPHVQLREVKSTMGSQNYLLPRRVSAEQIRSIVMWCVPVQNAYTAASLRPRAQ
jgi:hypothetical protein